MNSNKIILTLAFLLAISISGLNAQSNMDKSHVLQNYCKVYAYEIVDLAHPGADVYAIDIKAEGNVASIKVSTNSEGEISSESLLQLRINQNGYINDLEVVYDESLWPPFVDTHFIRERLESILSNLRDKRSAHISRHVTAGTIGRTNHWSNKDEVLRILNVLWIDNGYRRDLIEPVEPNGIATATVKIF